jgi:hypothetical protein
MKRYKSPHIDPIPSELIKARGRLITTWNEEELTEQWKKSIIVHIYNNVTKQTAVIIKAYHFCHLHTNTIL